MADSQADANGFVLTRETHSLTLTTATYARQSGHGSVAGYTLSGGRLFTFSGRIFGATPAERQVGISALESVIRPEGIPGAGLYPLDFETSDGKLWTVAAKVYSGLELREDESEGYSPTLSFTFQLFAEDPAFVSRTGHAGSGGVGIVGGCTLPAALPVPMSLSYGDVVLVNPGNTETPLYARVVGSALNPCLRNTTTGKFYKLLTSTSDLVLDNRTRGVIVEDAGVNKKAYRASGSEYLMLAPGANVLRLTVDNWSVDLGIEVSYAFNDLWLA